MSLHRPLSLLPSRACIVGARGLIVSRGSDDGDDYADNTSMIAAVLDAALRDSGLPGGRTAVDGLLATPSLRERNFMEAHYQATQLGMFGGGGGANDARGAPPRPRLRCKTIDTGGAGPISALLEGARMIEREGLEVVAIVSADRVGSMNSREFLEGAEGSFREVMADMADGGKRGGGSRGGSAPPPAAPAIPSGYDIITQYQMEEHGLTRDQLRMVVCLESFHAGMHPESLFHRERRRRRTATTAAATDDPPASPPPPPFASLDEIRDAPLVTPNISLLECARRADGAAAVILASDRLLSRIGLYSPGIPTVVGGGESSGPLFPPLSPLSSPSLEESNGSPKPPPRARALDEAYFSAREATEQAYASAGIVGGSDEIDFFGLYDCFPVCLIRALEACGLSELGKGGEYVEAMYGRMLYAATASAGGTGSAEERTAVLLRDRRFFPVNTHGGLLCYGAPWEVPAMYSVVEAVRQLRGEAPGRRIDGCRRALVYGNGGIFSHSAVAILANSR